MPVSLAAGERPLLGQLPGESGLGAAIAAFVATTAAAVATVSSAFASFLVVAVMVMVSV